jgi:hypothetical protein
LKGVSRMGLKIVGQTITNEFQDRIENQDR